MDSFDPFAEWLGRPPGRPPEDHYELLGLARFEPDIDLILHEADMLRVKIRKVRPGEHLADWQRLLDRLEAAKICLGDPIAKAAYDESIDTASHTLNVSGEPVVTWDSPDQETMMSSQTPENAQTDGAEAGFAPPSVNPTSDFVEAPPVARDVPTGPQSQGNPSETLFPAIRRTRRRSKGRRLPIVFLLFTLVLLSMAIGLVVLKRQKDERQAASAPPARQGTVAPIEKPVTLPRETQVTPRPADEPPLSPAEDPVPPPEPQPTVPTNVPPPKPPATVPAVTPTPPANPMPAPPSEPVLDPARQKAFQQALASTRKALTDRDLAAAASHLNEAVSLTQTDEERAEADQVEALRAYVEAFWESLQAQIPRLGSGSEIPVGEMMVVVVETGKDFLIVRANGRNQRFAINAMPHGLAFSVAQSLFSKSANAKVLLASFVIAEPDGNPDRARQLLREASQGGAEVDELLAELNRSP